MKKKTKSTTIFPKSNKTKQKSSLDSLVKASDRLIYQCTTVFPFTLFPDTIVVDQTKVDIVYRSFFFSKNVFPILIGDITTVKVFTNPFFASMHFEVVGYEKNPEPVRYLPKRRALKLHRIIMGLNAAKRKKIDLGAFDPKLVAQKAEEIGAAQVEMMGI